MFYEGLLNQYRIERMSETGIEDILSLMRGNPQYFIYDPPFPDAASVKADLHAVPEGYTESDKDFIGLYEDRQLICILDLIHHYPEKGALWIGLFMIARQVQGKGTGSAIIRELCALFRNDYRSIQLAYIKENEQAEQFWRKNGFLPTGTEKPHNKATAVIMKKEL